MRIRFIGASDDHVTGSCTHFSYDRKAVQFLVDCGLHQGENHALFKNRQKFPFDAADIKFVLLTHAHIDHCGLIPKLYRDGFQGVVFCTTATAQLARLSLLDSVRFSSGLYSEDDVKAIQFSCVDQRPDFGLSRYIPVDDDLFVSFTRTAHILGAMSLNISWNRDDGTRGDIVMSGDLGNNTKDNPCQPLLAGRQEPYGVPEYMVVESTYGSRVRSPHFSNYLARLDALTDVIKDAAFNRGKILIPAFSLQRTQEILLDLVCILESPNGRLPADIPILPVFSIADCIASGSWDEATNGRIKRALEAQSEAVQEQWRDAIEAREPDESNAPRYGFVDKAKVNFAEFRSIMMGYTKPLALKIDVDSPLTLRMTGVFGAELCRRQKRTPDETLYRNRLMAERLRLSSEAEVDDKIRTIFPINKELTGIEIALGSHLLRYQGQTSSKKSDYKGKKPVLRPKVPPLAHITISGGGMCEGGRVVDHLEHLLPSNQAVILITGYMASGTLGGKLAQLGRCRIEGALPDFTEIQVNDTVFRLDDIHAQIIDVGGYYSGHADQSGLLQYIFTDHKLPAEEGDKATTVFLNHGTKQSREMLKEAIEVHVPGALERKVAKVEFADSSRWYSLDLHEWIDPPAPEPAFSDNGWHVLVAEQKRTNTLLERLIDLMSPRQ